MTENPYSFRRPLLIVERPVDLNKTGDAPENAPLPDAVESLIPIPVL